MQSSRGLPDTGGQNDGARSPSSAWKRLSSKTLILLSVALLVFSVGAFADTDIDQSGGGGGGGMFAPVSATQLPGVNVNGSYIDNELLFGGGGNAGIVISPFTNTASLGPIGGGSAHTSANTASTTTKKQSKNPCPDKTGDPIVMSLGSKVTSTTEFSLPGEMGLKFERFYDSNFNGGVANLGSWRTSVDFHLFFTNCTNEGETTCPAVEFVRPDGSVLNFSPTTSVAVPATGSSTQLTGPFNGSGTALVTYNASNQTYVVKDEDSHVLTFDSTGKLLSIMDLANIGWTITHPNANTIVVTHTNGQYYTIAMVSGSQTLNSTMQWTVTDPGNNVYTYNSTYTLGSESVGAIGRVNSAIYPGSPATTISYTYQSPGTFATDELTEVDYNGDAHDLTGYDTTTGLATSTSMADGSHKVSVVYSSNSTGGVATLTNALGHVSVYQYDSDGLLVSLTGNATEHCAASYASSTYDANGNMSSSTDNKGNVTNYTYASNGLLQQTVENPGSSQVVTNYSWDPTPGVDRLLSVTVPGYAQTTYTYNTQGRVASVTKINLTGNGTSNQSLTTSYVYTLYPNGLVQNMSVVHPSPSNTNTDTYSYDTLGNLLSVKNGLGQTTTYSNYNGNGQVGQIIGPNGDTTDYTYNARGTVLTKTTFPNGVAATWTYTYDGFGLLATLTAPDGDVTTWTRNAIKQLTQITRNDKDGTSTETFGYDLMGNVTSDVVARGSDVGISSSASFDELGRTYQKFGNHGQVLTYSYDLNGNVTSETDAMGHVVSYQYDAFNRITRITHSGGATPPAITTSPVISAPSTNATGSYAISWSAAPNATSYTLREQANGGSWTNVQTSSATSWSASSQGTGSYSYQVQGCDLGGCGPWSVASTVTVLLSPTSAPDETVPATNNTGGYSVTWTAVSSATSYELQQQTNGGSWSTVQSTSATSFAVSGEGSATYGYGVAACNNSGCGPFSATSNVVVSIPPSSAPTLSAPSSSPPTYTVSWSGVSGATSYALQRQINGGSWSAVQSSPATSYAADSTTSASYGYRVQACDAGGCGAWSNTVTDAVTPPPSAAPTISGAGTSTTGTFTLTWNTVSAATNYAVYYVASSTDWVQEQDTSATSWTGTVSANGSYEYLVVACNAGGCGPSNNAVTETVLLPPPAPTGLGTKVVVVSSTQSGTYLTWNAVSTATSYQAENTKTGATVYSGTATTFLLWYETHVGANPPVFSVPIYPSAVRACNSSGCSAWVSP